MCLCAFPGRLPHREVNAGVDRWGSVGKIEFERQPGNRVMEYVEEMKTEGDKGGDVMVEEVFSFQQLFCSRLLYGRARGNFE